MDLEQLLSRLALALGIGLLIGLERGWRTRQATPGSRSAGIRTFAISGLLGGVTTAMVQASGGVANAGGGIVLAVAFASYAGVIALFTWEQNRADATFSATTAIAGLLTFSLGGYAIVGDVRIAAAAAVAAAAILALREELHGWIEKITWEELRSGVVLLAMTFIALPVMPDDQIGPLGGVNPRQVWILVIVLACVSFFGYAAVKYFGASRGVLISAALGGLVSSTAVTLANARRAALGEGSPHLLAAGVAGATGVSFLRVFAIVGAMQPRLLMVIGPPLIAATLAAAGFAWVATIARATESEKAQTANFRNPFELIPVLAFALFLAAIIILGQAVSQSFGAPAAFAGALVVGLVDVDSVAVSMARLAPDHLGPKHAVFAILAAVTSNTLTKVAIGAVMGKRWFAAGIGTMAALCIIAGAAALGLTLGFTPYNG